jgi:acetyl-CoA synthetase
MVDQFSELYETFRWHVPKGFNLATACCLQWAPLPSHERRPAIIEQDSHGNTRMTSFAELGGEVAQLANGLTRLGVIPGDRVIIVLKDVDTVMTALLACWAIRAVAVPLPPDSASETLLPKFKQARSQVALIDHATQEQALWAVARCPRIKHIVGIDVYDGRVMSWRGLIARQPKFFTPTDSLPSDPALLVWPSNPGADLPAQSALVLAHQALIGQLPGFVAAANWFPEQANQLLTTLKPWDDAGLLAAILPALYFGHSVILADKLPASVNLPTQVSHVTTTGEMLLSALKADQSCDQVAKPLVGLTVLAHTLIEPWQQRAAQVYGITPNLLTYITGCGVTIVQSHNKWQEMPNSSGHLVPGHHIRLVDEEGQVIHDTNTTGQIEISRVDHTHHTDPAQFIQVWSVKDMLDLGSELPNWWKSGLYAQALGQQTYRVLGGVEQWQQAIDHTISLPQLEQAVLLESTVQWSQVAVMPSRKPQSYAAEIWALIDVGAAPQRQMLQWREQLRNDITDRILTTIDTSRWPISVRVGLVDHQALSSVDRTSRCPWQTRAYQALIEFM